jgi:hypothetical protein
MRVRVVFVRLGDLGNLAAQVDQVLVAAHPAVEEAELSDEVVCTGVDGGFGRSRHDGSLGGGFWFLAAKTSDQ